MLLSEEQILGIRHGIEQGFISQGYSLSERERLIVELSVKTSLEFIEKVLKNNKDNY